MRIHISEPCKELLSPQYKIEPREDSELQAKVVNVVFWNQIVSKRFFQVGGFKSFFLNSKDGRKPLKESVIRALLPTEQERPKMEKDEEAPDANKGETEGTPGQEANGGNKVNGTMTGPAEVFINVD